MNGSIKRAMTTGTAKEIITTDTANILKKSHSKALLPI